jgi:hypothetical protein
MTFGITTLDDTHDNKTQHKDTQRYQAQNKETRRNNDVQHNDTAERLESLF